MSAAGFHIDVKGFVTDLIHDLASLDSQLVLLVVIIVVAVVVLDGVSIAVRRKKQAAGVSAKTVTVSIDGGKSLPVRNYISELQGLAGKPDALISEGGNIIPIERKPLARKLHDRYVAQILVYMRLVEEFEGKKPPYGYLILGPSCRRIRIENTAERQRWLQNILDEMRAILEKRAVAVAAPHPRKCIRCNVRTFCSHRVDTEIAMNELHHISKKAIQG